MLLTSPLSLYILQDMEKHTPGRYERAMVGAWNSGSENPYGILNPNRYRLQHVGDHALELMEEHLNMERLRVLSTLIPSAMQREYDRHLKIAARMLDHPDASYEKLYRELIEESRATQT